MASNLNVVPSQDIPNFVVAKVGSNGQVRLYNSQGAVDVIDVVGWLSSGNGSFTSLTPGRILDTRDGTGGVSGKVGPGQSAIVTVSGVDGVPSSGAGTVVMNVTATGATAGTYLTVFPTGQDRPLASNLNVVPGQDIPNLVVAKVTPTVRSASTTIRAPWMSYSTWLDGSRPPGEATHEDGRQSPEVTAPSDNSRWSGADPAVLRRPLSLEVPACKWFSSRCAAVGRSPAGATSMSAASSVGSSTTARLAAIRCAVHGVIGNGTPPPEVNPRSRPRARLWSGPVGSSSCPIVTPRQIAKPNNSLTVTCGRGSQRR